MRIPQPVENELASVLLHGVPPRRGSTVQPPVWFSSPFVAPSSAAQRTGCEAPSGLVPGEIGRTTVEANSSASQASAALRPRSRRWVRKLHFVSNTLAWLSPSTYASAER